MPGKRFSELPAAMQFRDLMKRLVRKEVGRVVGFPEYAIVTALNFSGRTATVQYSSGSTQELPYGSMAPSIGLIVRVAGGIGDRHIEDTLGAGALASDQDQWIWTGDSTQDPAVWTGSKFSKNFVDFGHDLRQGGKSVGRGLVDYYSYPTGAQADHIPSGGGSAALVTAASKTVQIVAGRKYKLHWSCYNTTGTVVGDLYQFTMGLTNATQFSTLAFYKMVTGEGTNPSPYNPGYVDITSYFTANVTGSAVMSVTFVRNSGSGTLQVRCNIPNPATLTIEDIGA